MTTWLTFLAGASFILAALPAASFLRNLFDYASAPDTPPRANSDLAVSVLIPARNEEQSIGEAVESVLAQVGVRLEVVVLDDQSEDRTAEIVDSLAKRDPRVRLVSAPTLPHGWCGKQHACWLLAQQARYPILAFIDADVRLRPNALLRAGALLQNNRIDLLSGVPFQETRSLLEMLLIPLVHFILLGFLPIRRMRKSVSPIYSAGCGQLFLTTSASYNRAGGHAAIRETLHDGLRLPRAYRMAGLRTDLFDATDLARCRMYRSSADLWIGLLKNAREGLATRVMIVPATLMLAGGQILPFVLQTHIFFRPNSWPIEARWLVAAAVVSAWLPRILAAARFGQSLTGALLHPISVLLFLAIQWQAFLRDAMGRPVSWKGRPYVELKQNAATPEEAASFEELKNDVPQTHATISET